MRTQSCTKHYLKRKFCVFKRISHCSDYFYGQVFTFTCSISCQISSGKLTSAQHAYILLVASQLSLKQYRHVQMCTMTGTTEWEGGIQITMHVQ
ncbi:hypothetical protein GDO86_000306 [Hymenochirus boettgeri]|uniref:Uncharacterized protein n=1 Tax=Hymenochirus boettgeri TaxID=247094 RepID=A0A8T2KB53_9PIPI|nr:hypothetical protein GDO86_000306 [Hymenochirus boettgeri]